MPQFTQTQIAALLAALAILAYVVYLRFFTAMPIPTDTTTPCYSCGGGEADENTDSNPPSSFDAVPNTYDAAYLKSIKSDYNALYEYAQRLNLNPNRATEGQRTLYNRMHQRLPHRTRSIP